MQSILLRRGYFEKGKLPLDMSWSYLGGGGGRDAPPTPTFIAVLTSTDVRRMMFWEGCSILNSPPFPSCHEPPVNLMQLLVTTLY